MQSRGFDLKLIGLRGEPLEGITSEIFPRSTRFSYLRYARAAARSARAFEPDLIHAHSVSGFGIWTLVSEFRPILVSVFGSEIVDRARGAVWRAIIGRVLNRAAWITSTSEFLRKETTSLYPQAAIKISVIPFGVEIPEKLVPPPDSETIKLCFLKHHRPVAGPDILIEAMHRLAREHINITLTLAGSGQMTHYLKKQVARYGLQDVVSFVGRIPPAEVYGFLAQHHALVMPSRAEAFGVAALEAAACSRPVIATRVGGVSEVVQDSETGLLVPPEDPEALAQAIIQLAQDVPLRDRLGQNGRRFVSERYPWDKSLDIMAELYERLIHEYPAHTAV
jgi:glycosyltransferase involved in cell wall biosynthesis